MSLDRLEPISAAARDEAAARAEQRREPAAIEANQGQHHLSKRTIDAPHKEGVPIAR